jgi:TnpA family transposase
MCSQPSGAKCWTQPTLFRTRRGVTYLNYTSDQFTSLGGLVIPGTIRDSEYVLEALQEQESGLTPTEIMSDTASYSDLMFVFSTSMFMAPIISCFLRVLLNATIALFVL